MMKKAILTVCVGIWLIMCAFTPKLDFRKNAVYKDKAFYFKYNWDKLIKAYEVMNARDSIFLLLKNEDYTDPSKVAKGKTGQINYVEVRLPGKDSVLFEMDGQASAKSEMKYLALLFAKYSVIDQKGYVNRVQLLRLANDMGKPYSRKRRELRR